MDVNYYGPTYIEDITVAGALLADKIQTLLEHVAGKEPLSHMDLEKIPNLKLKVEKVQLIDRFTAKPSSSVFGTLYITTSHVIFVSGQSGKEIWVLHSHISSVDRGSLSAAGCPLVIKCKTFLVLSLLISRDKDCHDVYETLLQLSQPVNIEEVYAFTYVPATKDMTKPTSLSSEHIVDDYHRMGIPNDNWIISDFNENYVHCDTYPQKLVVPVIAPKQILIGSCKFRSRGRLPVLTYYHSPSKAAICRCSQPLAGFSARCVEDESMMEQILKANPNCNVLYVIDTRPKVNAMVNKATGKGFEDEKNYSNIKFHFFSIENIHVMRNSMQKLIDVCSKPASVTQFMKGLDDCGWLRHIRLILETGAFIADSVVRGISCVVHCSDGWDRTAQSTAIAAILLDPYYRTLKGFKTLIEKDWLAFGHKFSDRCGHAGNRNNDEPTSNIPGTGNNSTKEMSPVFTQFLDCVWQLMVQFPRSFEFRESYLIELHDHVHSCQFGTFLGNCEKDRMDLRLSERTFCLWSYLERKTNEFLNPLYIPEGDKVLIPDIRGFSIRFWRGMYNRFDSGVHPRESICDSGAMVREHICVLHDHLQVLHSRVCELRQLLGKTTLNVSVMIDSGHSSGSCLTEVGQQQQGVTSNDNAQSHKSKYNSEPESGVDEPQSPTNAVKKSVKGRNPMLSQLSQVGMLESLTSLDLSSTDLSAPEIASVAVRWQSLRKAQECNSCRTQFAYAERKCHCNKCGLIFCRRCLCPYCELPGLSNQMEWPLCKTCSQDMNLSSPLINSMTAF